MDDLDPANAVSARLGMTLRGKYRLDSVLGVGGMAAVYAATHRNQKRFAVKLLHPELSRHAEIRARFLREGYAANTVGHPGAVTVLDDDVAEDGSAFLVMDLLEGETVDVVRERLDGKLPPAIALAVAYRVLDVLVAAHAKNVVHRDIKPDNVFLTRDGAVKVLDFGIAKLRDSAHSAATHTGVALGTPAFMSPEQARGKLSQVDGCSDVWSVGAMLFTMISGEHVHDGESAQEVMMEAATRPARSLATAARETPVCVVGVVDRALAFTKETRWPTAAAMRSAVASAYRELRGEDVATASLASVCANAVIAVAHSKPPNPLGETVVSVEIPHLAPADLAVASSGAPAHKADAVVETSVPLVTEAPASRARAPIRRWPLLVGGAAAVLVTALGAVAIMGAQRSRSSATASDAPTAPPPTPSLPTTVASEPSSASSTAPTPPRDVPPSPGAPSAVSTGAAARAPQPLVAPSGASAPSSKASSAKPAASPASRPVKAPEDFDRQ